MIYCKATVCMLPFGPEKRKNPSIVVRSMYRSVLFVAVTAAHIFAGYLNSLNLSGTPAENGNDITFSTSGTPKVSVTVCYPDVVRLWVEPDGSFSKESSFAIDTENWSAVNRTVTDKGAYFQILTSELSVRINKNPVRISIYKADNATLISEERSDGGIGWDAAGGPHYAHWNLGANEHILGLGEDNESYQGKLDRKGTTRNIWAVMMPRAGYTPSNICIPFFMSSGNAGNGYGFYYDNTYNATFDMGKTSSRYYSWKAKGGENVIYFFQGPSFKKILARYVMLTGQPDLPPVWAFGYLQSKCAYGNWNQIDNVVNLMQTNNLPLEAMVLDFNWPATYGDFQWSGGPFAGGETKVAAYRPKGVRIIVSNSGPEILPKSSIYAGAQAAGVFAKCGSGPCEAGWYNGHLFDPTAPNFSSWLWGQTQVRHLLQEGVAGWWLDLTEPENEPGNAVYTAGPSAKIHNVYSNIISKCYYQGQLQLAPDSRPYVLTRCGFSGIQKYCVTIWSGDNYSDYPSFEAHVPESQNASLSGIPWWSMDIGGFQDKGMAPYQYYKNDKMGAHAKLYQRWFQFGCFTPITRSHGVKDCEPYQFGAAVTESNRKYLRLRYRLIPYIYSYAYECFKTGVPLQRALALEYQDDPGVYGCRLQYLFGKEFLVAPVVAEDATTKFVYFPEGTWIDYDDGTVYKGKNTATVPAPGDKLPLFVKAGAIIPMAPAQLHLTDSTGAKRKWDPITLDIYPDETSTFSLYQDDGLTRAFQTKAVYTQTTVTSAHTPSKQEIVTIVESNKLFTPATYEYKIHFPSQAAAPSPVRYNGQAVDSLTSQAAYSAAAAGRWWDAAGKALWVKVSTSAATSHILTVSLDGSPVSAEALNSAGALPRTFDMRVMPARTRGGAAMMMQIAVPYAPPALRIDLLDLRGRLVACVAHGRYEPGYHVISLDRSRIGSGWYLCRMKAGSFEKAVTFFYTAF